jgi:hypothetical protein
MSGRRKKEEGRRKKEEGRTLSKNIGDIETNFSFIPSFLFPLFSITKSFFLHFPISDLINSKSIQNGWRPRILLKILIVVILITGIFFRFTRPGSQSLLFRRISHLAANFWLHLDGNNAARFSRQNN